MPQIVRPPWTGPELPGQPVPDPCPVVSLLVTSILIVCPHEALKSAPDPLAGGLEAAPGPACQLPSSVLQIIAEPALERVRIGEGNCAYNPKFLAN